MAAASSRGFHLRPLPANSGPCRDDRCQAFSGTVEMEEQRCADDERSETPYAMIGSS
jgi:hypothetical protein